MKSIFFALLISLISSFSWGEYRVYRLGIKYQPEDEEIEVLTTLDHLQYETYYKISSRQQTRIIKHWMCYGRTDYETPYCPEPIKTNPNLSPANETNLRSPAQQAQQ